MGLSRVVRGGFWLYAASIVNNVFGFVFWLAVSRVAGPEVVGLVSATAGLAGTLLGVLVLGVPVGLVHVLGAVGRSAAASELFWSGLALEFLALLLGACALVGAGVLGWSFGGYSPLMLVLAGLFLVLGVSGVFASLFTGLLDLFPYFLVTVAGNVLKVAVGVGLVLLGWGWIGAALGYMMITAATVVAGAVYAVSVLGLRPAVSWRRALEVLRAGVPGWAPGVVAVLGQQLAVVAVFGSVGAVETGRFYVAMTIAGFVAGVAGTLQRVMLPYLSGLSDGRKRAASRSLILGAALVAPPAAAVLAFGDRVLGLLGRGFVEGWPLLAVLLLSLLVQLPIMAVSNLCYAYRRYRDVFWLGLAGNATRLALYVALAPALGSMGVALAFAAGSVAGAVAAQVEAGRVGFRVGWWRLFGVLGVMMAMVGVGAGLRLVPLPWPVGAVLVVGAGYLALMRLGLLRREDVVILGRALVPDRFRPAIWSAARLVLDMVYG